MGSTTFWKLNLWCAFITSPCFSSSGFFQPTYILRKMVKYSYTTEVKLSSWIFQASSKTWLLLSCRMFSLQNVKHEIHFLKNKIFTALKWKQNGFSFRLQIVACKSAKNKGADVRPFQDSRPSIDPQELLLRMTNLWKNATKWGFNTINCVLLPENTKEGCSASWRSSNNN